MSHAADTTAYLTYKSHDGKTNKQYLNVDVVSIGRRSQNTIVLDSDLISKQHAFLERSIDPQGSFVYTLIDNHSVNGVFVNGAKIDGRVRLSHNDKISISGQFNMLFVNPATSMVQQQRPMHYGTADGAVLPRPRNQNSSESATRMSMHRLSMRRNIGGTLPTRMSVASFLDQGTLSSADSYFSDESHRIHLVPVTANSDEIEIHNELTVSHSADFLPARQLSDNIEILIADYEKLRMTYELTKILSMCDVQEMFEQTLDLMFEVLPVLDRGAAMVRDKHGEMTVVASKIIQANRRTSTVMTDVAVPSSIFNKVMTSKKAILSSDVLEDPHMLGSESIRSNGIRSVMCVPILVDDQVFGLLHLDSRKRIHAFQAKDLAMVTSMTNQLGTAIQNRHLQEKLEHEVRVIGELGRFMPPHIVERMLDNSETIQRGGREMRGTVIFADIRGFTELSERTENPQDVVDMLNDFFDRLTVCVFNNGGVLDKFIGDAVMAVFGTLDGDEDAEAKAVMAGLEMREAIREWNDERAENGLEEIHVGVGINTGNLVAGFIGCRERLEYTCIGDTVNTSSRICGCASGGQVLVSESTKSYVQDRFRMEFQGNHKFKGKNNEIKVYNVLGPL